MKRTHGTEGLEMEDAARLSENFLTARVNFATVVIDNKSKKVSN